MNGMNMPVSHLNRRTAPGFGGVLCGRWLMLGAGLLLVGFLPNCAAAQEERPAATPSAAPAPKVEWAEIRTISDADLKQWKKDHAFFGTMKKIVEGKIPLEGDDKDFFDLYIGQYFLPQFTQEKYQASLPDLRDELMGYYRTAAARSAPAVTRRLNEMVFDMMLAIASGTVRAVSHSGGGVDVIQVGQSPNRRFFRLDMREIPTDLVAKVEPARLNFHYAARLNAMLMFGELNEKMEVHRGQVTRVEPLLNALGPMNDIAVDESYPDYVRSAALIGIRRHMDPQSPVEQEGVPPGLKDLIVSNMLQIATHGEPLAGRSIAGNVWIRRQAVEILGACGSEGADQNVAKMLSSLVADGNEPLKLRSAAAEALGRLNRTKVKPGAIVDLVKQLAGLATDAAKYELSTSVDKQPLFSRRRAAATVGSVLTALAGQPAVDAATEGRVPTKLTGIYPSATSDEQPFVKGIIERVGQLRAACGNLTLGEAALRTALGEGVDDINKFVAAGPEAAAAAERSGEAAPKAAAPKRAEDPFPGAGPASP